MPRSWSPALAAPWVISLVLHLAAMGVLVCLVFSTRTIDHSLSFHVTMRPPEPMKIVELPKAEPEKAAEPAPPAPEAPPAVVPAPSAADNLADDDEAAPSGVPDAAVLNPEPSPVPFRQAVVGVGNGPAAQVPSRGVPSLISGRGQGKRGEMLGRFGGTPASEQCVMDGLRWLVRHQDPSGAWLAGDRGFRRCPPKDRCRGETQAEFGDGITGLALLCFLGAGHTHREGEFAEPIRLGLEHLIRVQPPEESVAFCRENLYNRAIAALALCEAFALSRDADLAEPAQRAITWVQQAQGWSGGWDYAPGGGRNDMSITGWVIMALKSAQIAGLWVDPGCWKKAQQALAEATSADGRVRYALTELTSPRRGDALSAVGILCRYYFGDADPDLQDRAAQLVTRDPPAWKNLKKDSPDYSYYAWYYETLAIFQRGGQEWRDWNRAMRDLLIEHQCKTGHAQGSWDPDDTWGKRYGGRMYSTTLSILTLEVYYRYLPIYFAKGQEAPADAADRNRAAAATRVREAQARLDRVKTPDEYLADLQGADPLPRWKAARALADRGDVRATEVLRRLIPTLDATAQAVYLEILGRFCDPGSVDFLAAFLTHPENRVRVAALSALQRATGMKDVNQVNAWLEKRARRGEATAHSSARGEARGAKGD